MGEERTKMETRLVERPRQETWWHGQDFIAPVPHYPDPTVKDSRIAVVMDRLVYCLDANFGFANVWEFDLESHIGLISSPQWWGKDRIALTTLLSGGKYQGIVIDIAARKTDRYTLMKGKEYHPLQVFEDRYPVKPIVIGNNLFFFSPYGHFFDVRDKIKKSIGRNIRIYQPKAFKNQLIIHTRSNTGTRLEWRQIDGLEQIALSQYYDAKFGIATGQVGSAPFIRQDSVICGFGDRLSSFSHNGEIEWEFYYPRIDALESDKPMQILTPDGEVVYQTTSEVDLGSNFYNHGHNLYFVLSEYTRHISYLTKMDVESGEVIWTSKITGLSGGFNIIDVSSKGLIMQNGTWLWIVAEDGSIRSEAELDIDCASCSNLVRLSESKYVVLADLGVHEVEITMSEFYSKPVSSASGSIRQVFLSHASEDKAAIVRPFYEACERRGLSAWFDAAEIRWGDSLTGKIEEGLSKSKYIILFISRNFLNKPWPQKELESALSMEVNGKKIVLPIILGISHQELEDKHPIIASKLYRAVPSYKEDQIVNDSIVAQLIDELENLFSG